MKRIEREMEIGPIQNEFERKAERKRERERTVDLLLQRIALNQRKEFYGLE